MKRRPTMVHGEADTRFPKSMDPPTEKLRRFKLTRINPSGARGKRFHAQFSGPSPQRSGVKVV
jgi:hypothetical protein